ncbi:hypothetical protein EPUS_03976 [Endocarpon pusillum Z07020]|uniref:Uncharacterized protein n=1 Tax=Endocarpon pusillum (strain Z07020 / HMAS-L-300199) TaxID=1263415 RepID=U1FWP2_ENDPU|nr:uncharacterized protein EPUS_03976 [Endocarpon pusillum Z07020]ERF69272.1 hypothetical protein EPUS_03976 [Endocarpon pusillum Z07020]
MSGQGDRPQPPSRDKRMPKHTPSAHAEPSTSAARVEAARTTSAPLPINLNPANPRPSVSPEIAVILGPCEGVLPASRGVGLKRPMDLYRFWLLRDIRNNTPKVKLARERLARADSNTERLMGAYYINQYRKRAMFMLNESTNKITRLQEEFEASYSPLMRQVAGQQGVYYAAEIQQTFQNEPDPSKRLQILQARLNALDVDTPDQSRRDLFCQYQLVVDEERRELAGTGPSRAPNPSTEAGPAEAAADRASGPADPGPSDPGPSDPSRKRRTPEKPTLGRAVEGRTAQANLSGTGATPTTPASTAKMRHLGNTITTVATTTLTPPQPSAAEAKSQPKTDVPLNVWASRTRKKD